MMVVFAAWFLCTVVLVAAHARFMNAIEPRP
jgi:hypothetical protein